MTEQATMTRPTTAPKTFILWVDRDGRVMLGAGHLTYPDARTHSPQRFTVEDTARQIGTVDYMDPHAYRAAERIAAGQGWRTRGDWTTVGRLPVCRVGR